MRSANERSVPREEYPGTATDTTATCVRPGGGAELGEYEHGNIQSKLRPSPGNREVDWGIEVLAGVYWEQKAGGEVVRVELGEVGDGEVAVLLVEDAVFRLGGAVDVVAGLGFGGHEFR
jgi:hypothetical protein